MSSNKHNWLKKPVHTSKYFVSFVVIATLGGCGGGASDNIPATETTPSESRQLVPVQSEAILEAYLKQSLLSPSPIAHANIETRVNIEVSPDANQAPTADDNQGGQFSETNTQEEGVDEADVIKYDGEYLYVSNSTSNYCCWAFDTVPEPRISANAMEQDQFSRIRILKSSSDPAAAKEVATLTLSLPQSHIDGLYLHQPGDSESNGKQLIALASAYGEIQGNYRYDYWGWYASRTHLHFFDVNTPETAAEIHTLQIQGQLVSSRVADGKLHLVTRFTPYVLNYTPVLDDSELDSVSKQAVENTSLDSLLPKQKLDGNSVELLVKPERCFVPEYEENNHYPTLITITTIDLDDPNNRQSVCVAGYHDNIYANTNSLYLAQQNYEYTRLHHFEFSDNGPQFIASGKVDGNLGWRNASFRLSEHNDLLRVVTSLNREHQLFVMESDSALGTMTMVAKLPNDARPQAIGEPGDGVDAVRFVGNRAYVATSLQIDPLYIIDLQDPYDPFIAGSVKLPGFSNYLHPINESLLLGIGMETSNVDDLTRQEGVKVVLFDTQDPSQPSVSETVILGNRGSSTPLLWDHKAFAMVEFSPEQYRFAIPVSIHDSMPQYENFWNYDWSYDALALFELDTTTSELDWVGQVQSYSRETHEYKPWTGQQRGVLHGDLIHFVDGDKVWSANWNTPKDISESQ